MLTDDEIGMDIKSRVIAAGEIAIQHSTEDLATNGTKKRHV